MASLAWYHAHVRTPLLPELHLTFVQRKWLLFTVILPSEKKTIHVQGPEIDKICNSCSCTFIFRGRRSADAVLTLQDQ